MDWSKYKNFTAKEFACSHCGANEMQAEFMDMLQTLRLQFNKPIVITSGYRCEQHPNEINKLQRGAHTYGCAADIAVQGADAYNLLHLAFERGFSGIGVQQKGASRFIHLDNCKSGNGLLRPAVWSY